MPEYVTTKEFKTVMREHTDEILDVLHTFMQQVDERFNAVDKRMDKLEREMLDLKEAQLRLLNTIDGFVSRIDKYETELAARDAQFERLLAWARKVSEKTGIPLDNL